MKHTRKLRSKRRKQTGGSLCPGDISLYEMDPTNVVGRGQSGIVFGVVDHPDLVVKVQSVPIDIKRSSKLTWELQNELACATIAGELGIGPRIHHLAICDAVSPQSSRFSHLQLIKWVMDKIEGNTLYNILKFDYPNELKRQGKTRKEINEMTAIKQQEFAEEVEELIDDLKDHGIILNDIHGGNIMYGSIRGGAPRIWIIDFGHARRIPITNANLNS